MPGKKVPHYPRRGCSVQSAPPGHAALVQERWFRCARTALSSQPSLEQAIDEVAGSLKGMGQADLALVFCSSSFASDLPRLPLLQQKLQADHWLGACGDVVGTNPRLAPGTGAGAA